MFSEVRRHTFGPIVVERPMPRGIAPVGTDSHVAEDPIDPEAIEAAAWAEGFEKGYGSGLRSAQQEQEATLLQLVTLTRNALEDADEFNRALERQVVDLSLAIAEKVVERELRTDPAVVVDVVRAALEDARGMTTASVRVNPEDHPLVAPLWERLAPRPLPDRAQLVADERVERGGCLIETQMGVIDAQLSSKLSEIANGFEGVMEGEPL